MTRGRWPGRQVEDLVTAEAGMSFEELAGKTGVPYSEVKAAVWVLYGMRRVDICAGYVVAVPSREGRRAP